VEKSLFQLIPSRWGMPKIWATSCCLLLVTLGSLKGQALPGAVSQQAVTDAQAQQERERQKKHGNDA
jgi:hypothetical protein